MLIPPGARAGALVWRLSTRWRTAVDRAVAPHGLTHATYVVLTTLFAMRGATPAGEDPGAPSQRALAEVSGLEPMYVSRLVRTLEADGLVARSRDDQDSRVVRLELTERGLAVVRPAMRTVQALLDQLLAPLGGRDSPRSAELVAMLTALLDAPLDARPDTPPDTPLDPGAIDA
ncbi:MarR family transcriptional regulator [Cellulosimicrobium sp. Marseille-Q4280]|uniref:MarR family winged helix-turn-helix transcriptional regulator n=1 Tax=Cellulosimicrobium sp. Marseille-Q4280 TaxID=2937992 RepID=UPI00203FADC9|nr:MarR family transcriptional regulator [Cellulosimicrobium sp. Marseille-Q4280]